MGTRGDICTFPTFKSSPSLPNFMPKRSARAKSEILDRLFGPLDLKSALYPNVRILAVLISGSSGSHSCGQNVSGRFFKVQVLRLEPPNPCTKMISTECGFDGAYRTLSPVGSESWLPVGLRPKNKERILRLEGFPPVFDFSAL